MLYSYHKVDGDMESLIGRYWKELQQKIVSEQVFYLFVMLIFSEGCRCMKGIAYSGKFTQKSFKMSFEDVYDYDFKVAVHRFSEKVDWVLVENDEEIQRILGDVGNYISTYMRNGVCGKGEGITERMDVLLQAVLELEGWSGTYQSTPASVQKLVAELLSGSQAKHMLDLCCGTGLYGLTLYHKLSRENPALTFCGIEVEPVLCDIADINLYLHGVERGRIVKTDLLALPRSTVEELADLIVMDIPRGNNVAETYDRRDYRLIHFDKQHIYSDWIFIQDALYRLNVKGRAAVLATSGALIRLNEKGLREQIVLSDWLEAVITLPSNLYPRMGIGTELLIFNKNKRPERREKILFIDISSYYKNEKRNMCAVTEEGIYIAGKCYRHGTELSGISVMLKSTDLDADTCSFKPIQYIQLKEEERLDSNTTVEDIADIIRGSQTLTKIAEQEKGTACFINIKDIQDGRIIYETAERIQEGHPAYKEKFRVREDDILLTSKGSVIKAAVVGANPPPAFISGNITLLRVDERKYDPYILLEYLYSGQGQLALERIQSGTTIRILSNASIKKMKVPEYDKEHMKVIGKQLKQNRERYFSEQKRLTESYQKERQKLLEILKEEKDGKDFY